MQDASCLRTDIGAKLSYLCGARSLSHPRTRLSSCSLISSAHPFWLEVVSQHPSGCGRHVGRWLRREFFAESTDAAANSLLALGLGCSASLAGLLRHHFEDPPQQRAMTTECEWPLEDWRPDFGLMPSAQRAKRKRVTSRNAVALSKSSEWPALAIAP